MKVESIKATYQTKVTDLDNVVLAEETVSEREITVDIVLRGEVAASLVHLHGDLHELKHAQTNAP